MHGSPNGVTPPRRVPEASVESLSGDREVSLGPDFLFFRLTFWPRFYGSRNYQRYQVEEKDLGQCGTDMCTEFRCGSCNDSHLSWRDDICNFLPGSLESLILLLLDMLDFQGCVF